RRSVLIGRGGRRERAGGKQGDRGKLEQLRLHQYLPAMNERHQFPHVSAASQRSEEHTSELQSRENLVCRLLLEKKKNKAYKIDKMRSQERSSMNATRYDR